jgi:hypothetical protein
VAWEGSLSAAVLSGYMAAGMNISPQDSSLTLLGHFLTLVSRVRCVRARAFCVQRLTSIIYRYHVHVTMQAISSALSLQETLGVSEASSLHTPSPATEKSPACAASRNSSRLIGLKRKGSPMLPTTAFTPTSAAAQLDFENRKSVCVSSDYLPECD